MRLTIRSMARDGFQATSVCVLSNPDQARHMMAEAVECGGEVHLAEYYRSYDMAAHLRRHAKRMAVMKAAVARWRKRQEKPSAKIVKLRKRRT